MAKKFFCVMPLQIPLSNKYDLFEKRKNTYDSETHFPIIPVIFNNTEKKENIKVIPIIFDNQNAKNNITLFEQELSAISHEKGFTFKISPIYIPDKETLENHLNLFSNLISLFENDDCIYADITFGTKPLPIVFITSLNYAYRIKNVEIGIISYARFPHTSIQEHGILYDITPLFLMNTLIDKVASANIKNPEDFIMKLLSTNKL